MYERGIDVANGDSVSIVIDVDDRTKDELCEIETQSRNLGYDLYFSNRSFECWLIMHFHGITKAMSQDELESELTTCLGRRYRKSEGIGKFDRSRVESAMKNAENIISDRIGYNSVCAERNPSTTVHILVKKILNTPQ